MPKRKDFNDPAGETSKKVRFGSEEPTDEGELDWRSVKKRKGVISAAKGEDGFDSDSSGGEDEPQKAGAKDEDDDMFADDAHTKQDPATLAKDQDTRVRDKGLDIKDSAREKETLDLGDIEGQEFGATSETHGRTLVAEDDEDYIEGDENANADDAIIPESRKSAEGMGFAISSFNMQDEMAEGRFTTDGDYIRVAKDPEAYQDIWLQQVSSKDLQAAAAAKAKHDKEAAERERAEANSIKSRIECLKALLEQGLMDEGESVTMALGRWGRLKKAAEPKRTNNKRAKLKPENAGNEQHVKFYKAKIDDLTTLADMLLSAHGENDVYDETYEGIIRQLVAEAEVPRGWQPTVTAQKEPPESASNGQVQQPQTVKPGLIARPP